MGHSLNIVIFSNEPWGDQWFSKQHYANELSLLGHHVTFINPPTPWKISFLFRRGLQLIRIQENLNILSYNQWLPVRMFPKWLTFLNDWLLTRRLRSWLQLSTSEQVIIWQFDINRMVHLSIKNAKRIYHVVDPYMHFWSDNYIAAKADLIVVTSPKYLLHYEHFHPANEIVHIPRGVANAEFVLEAGISQQIAKHFAPYALLVGSLNDDVDYTLLEQVAKEYRLVILGKETVRQDKNSKQWTEIKQHKNVTYMGVVASQELKNYVNAAMLCLVLYQFNLQKAIGSGSPLKLLNYLAQHKPTITTIDPEIPELLNKGIFWAKNMGEFRQMLQSGMAGELAIDSNAIMSYLDAHRYPVLINKILTHLHA